MKKAAEYKPMTSTAPPSEPISEKIQAMGAWSMALLSAHYGAQFRAQVGMAPPGQKMSETELQRVLRTKLAYGRAMQYATPEGLQKAQRLIETAAPAYPPKPSTLAEYARSAPEQVVTTKQLRHKASPEVAAAAIAQMRRSLA